MATLADMIDGADPTPLYAHLTQQTIVEPIKLADLVEASWDGYGFAPVFVQSRVELPGGLGWLKCVAVFFVGDVDVLPTVTTLYVTDSLTPPMTLLLALNLTGSTAATLSRGDNWFQFNCMTFVLPTS